MRAYCGRRFYDRQGKLISADEFNRLHDDNSDYNVIGVSTLGGVFYVVTLWLGVDHDAEPNDLTPAGEPLIFESRVFLLPILTTRDHITEGDLATRRYADEHGARVGHAELCKAANARVRLKREQARERAQHMEARVIMAAAASGRRHARRGAGPGERDAAEAMEAAAAALDVPDEYVEQIDRMAAAAGRWFQAHPGREVSLRMPISPVSVIAELSDMEHEITADDPLALDLVRTVNAAVDGQGTLIMLDIALNYSRGCMRVPSSRPS